MRLFISYARIDKAYCVRVVDVLNAHKLWYDERLYAGQNWWKEILRRLEWCEAFVFLLSPDSIASEYCRREFEIAQSLNKPIIPILIRRIPEMPEYVSEMQYIDITEDLTVETVKTLLNTIHFIQEDKIRLAPKLRPTHGTMLREDEEGDLITRAVDAMKNGSYDQAVFLLNRCKDLNIHTAFINIDALLKEAEYGLNDLIQQREMQRNYEQIRNLFALESTRRLGIEAFQRFHEKHPHYDPDNLLKECRAYANAKMNPNSQYTNGNGNGHHKSIDIPKPIAKSKGKGETVIHPEWCKIPKGIVRVDSEQQFDVYEEEFYISRYPITNAHYQVFLKDPKGYNNISWWEFSEAAIQSRLQNPTPQEPMFKGLNRPRENVTWYDAVAFCRWLSHKSKRRIQLPTLAQRQRAIQGDDDRIYPWGNEFNPEYCNSHEGEMRMTTVVNRYAKGVSPYGVYDLIGNVWEWCIDETHEEGDDKSLDTAKKRIVHGGSFLSGSERCHVDFRYVLSALALYSSIGFRIILLPE